MPCAVLRKMGPQFLLDKKAGIQRRDEALDDLFVRFSLVVFWCVYILFLAAVYKGSVEHSLLVTLLH